MVPSSINTVNNVCVLQQYYVCAICYYSGVLHLVLPAKPTLLANIVRLLGVSCWSLDEPCFFRIVFNGISWHFILDDLGQSIFLALPWCSVVLNLV